MAAWAPRNSRPLTRHPAHVFDDDADDDDDDSGGISLAAFALPTTPPLMLPTPPTAPMASMAPTAPLDLAASYHVSTVHLPAPAPPPPPPPMSSAEHVLEPPPTLHDAHLSILDRASFAPITSFFHYLTPDKPLVPGLDLVPVPDVISRHDLHGDRFDFQGIDWAARNTTRAAVRAKRRHFEHERLPPAIKALRTCIPPTPNTDAFFSFRRNVTSNRAFFPHFQLRNVLAATSRNDIYYAAGHRVFRTDAEGSRADAIVDLSKRLASDGSITTIATTDSVLIAGAFEGEYAITDLTSTYGSPCTFGRASDYTADTKSRIVNHLHLFESRITYTPQAVLCSNDHRLRILDCATNTFTHVSHYPAAVNCSATSPNGRMRVVVGDFQETLITNAETGRPFETLKAHTDDAFACAWADDGIHVATAAQDSTIVVWDARYWAKPLKVMSSELSIPRSLRFSPVGSGPRVLVAAEADDYVNIINAQTFDSKQLFDFFGPLGGVTFTPDGQSLFVANGERRFGGIIELDRTGWAETTARRRSWGSDGAMSDWAHEEHLSSFDRVPCGAIERQRRHVDLSQLVV